MQRTLALVLSFAVLPSLARADDGPIDQAWARYRAAEFRAAIDSLDAAEADGTLAADDYPRSLEIRALAAHALGDEENVARTLRLLAAVDPGYVLGPEAGPPLRERLDAERASGEGRAGIEVAAEERDGNVHIEARVRRDPLDLVRRLDVYARTGDTTDFTRAERTLQLAAGGAAAVTYYAEAIGPAGVVLAREGSSERPLYLTLDEPGLGAGWWILIAAGAALLVAGAVITTVALTASEDSVAIDGPELPF